MITLFKLWVMVLALCVAWSYAQAQDHFEGHFACFDGQVQRECQSGEIVPFDNRPMQMDNSSGPLRMPEIDSSNYNLFVTTRGGSITLVPNLTKDQCHTLWGYTIDHSLRMPEIGWIVQADCFDLSDPDHPLDFAKAGWPKK